MATWIKNKIAEMIKRDLGIEIDPDSIVGVNRGHWYAYPEAYRWHCDEISGEKRRLWCAASMKFCLFLGGFEHKLYEELGHEWELNLVNKNKRTPDEILHFKLDKRR